LKSGCNAATPSGSSRRTGRSNAGWPHPETTAAFELSRFFGELNVANDLSPNPHEIDYALIQRYNQSPQSKMDTRQLYELLIEPIRSQCRNLGYAIAVHGSLNRDIDLIAVPWTADAVSPRRLAEEVFAVAWHVNWLAHWSWFPARGQEFTLEGGPGIKPHGRLGWVINLTMGKGPYIDLSVMPPQAADSAHGITPEWLFGLSYLRFKRSDWTSGTFDVDVFLDEAELCVRFWEDGKVDVILGKTGDTQLHDITRQQFLCLLRACGVTEVIT
jgi:hypothetical protein